jgi:hypothetical protein
LEEAAQQITDKISISGVNKMKRLGGKILRKNRNLRFNNNTAALIFGSFHQGKELRSHFKIKHFKIKTNSIELFVLYH